MARMVHDVFLASPFEEFQLLRKLLNIKINKMVSRFPISIIDLNDGAVRHSPPVKECISKARQSDFMILLMGDTYGSYAPNENKSYTHLEYESVIYENSPTIVLVFCIGDSYKNNNIRYSHDENFKKFQKLVEANHTIGYFTKEQSVEEIGEKIIQELLIAVNTRIMSGHMSSKSAELEYDGDKIDFDAIKEVSKKTKVNTSFQRLNKFVNNIYKVISDSIYKFFVVAGVLVALVFFIKSSSSSDDKYTVSSIEKYSDTNITEHNNTNVTEDGNTDRLLWHCIAKSARASGWVERIGKQNAIRGALAQCEVRTHSSLPCKIVNCYISK